MPRKKENAETALRIGVIRNPKNPKELIVEGSRVGGSGVSEHRIKEATVYVGSPRKATENELADAARSLRNHAAIIPSWVDDCMAHYGPNAAMHPDAGQERVSALWYALAIRGCRDEINRNIDLGFPYHAAQVAAQLGALVEQASLKIRFDGSIERDRRHSTLQSQKGRASGERRREQSYVNEKSVIAIAKSALRDGTTTTRLVGEVVVRMRGSRRAVPAAKTIRPILRKAGLLPPKRT